MINRQFILAGKACFTLGVPAEYAEEKGLKSHYTFNVLRKDQTGKPGQFIWFVSLLSGPCNESDYTYLGTINENVGVRLTKKSKLTQDSILYKVVSRLFICLLSDQTDRILNAEFTLNHEGKCCRCGHKLTTPESVARGIGPECFGIMSESALPALF